MSAITIDNDLVHYEVLGRGRPVILIHGWLGSWRYWIPVMQQLSANYRVYALDLYGFGDSQKNTSRYSLQSQVNLLAQFMEKLGINKAALVGHSFGAAIAIAFARRHEALTSRVMTISAPLFAINADALPMSPAAVAGKKSSGNVAAAMPVGSASLTSATPKTTTSVLTAAPAQPSAATKATPAPETPAPSTGTTLLPMSSSITVTDPAAPPAQPSAATKATPAPETPAPSTGTTLLPMSSSITVTDPAAPPAALATSTQVSPIPPSTPTPSIANDETLRRNPFLDHPERLAQIGITPPTPPLNPLATLMTNVKPKTLLERQLIRDDDTLRKLRDEVDKTDEAAVAESVRSFVGVNLALELCYLSVPVLLLHGKSDPFLPAPEDELLSRIGGGKPLGPFFPLVVPDFRHFPMLENTSKFNRLLMDFLDAKLTTDVQINLDLRETWRRQLR